MTGYLSTACGPDGHCITCSDQATPMRVVGAGGAGLAFCTDAGGNASEVEVTLVNDVVQGDLLLVHAGVAIARLPAEGSP
ncbi:MAG: HypC/HybG/HupF family hydrogenase formation chaperone [Gemmatimonadales bacterium]|nr:HypC/HybG/HupF family hydrogenase formation chaperone [Gemmatimonadales bacterium]